MKRFSRKQKQIFAGVVSVFLVTVVAVSLLNQGVSPVNIGDQSLPMAAYSQTQAPNLSQLEEALERANEKLALAVQEEAAAQDALTAAQTAVAAADSGLTIAQTLQAEAATAAEAAVSAAAAAAEDEALASAASAAEAALAEADANLATAQQTQSDAQTALPLAQAALDAAVQAAIAAQEEADAAQDAFTSAGGSASSTTTDDSTEGDSTEDDSTEDDSDAQDDDSAQSTEQAETFSMQQQSLLDGEEDETSYEVVLHTLNNKLLRYNNAESTNAYISAISTEYATLEPELVQNEDGEVVEVTVGAEALSAAGTPSAAVAYSDFLGWSTSMDMSDLSVIPAGSAHTFAPESGTEEEGVVTFHLYAKYGEIETGSSHSIRANGQTFQALAYPASELAATGNLPAPVLYTPIQSEHLQTLEDGSGGLYGYKDATWENYEEGLGSIHFDFAMEPQTYDTDIVIVMDKSTSMPSGYVNNGISNWSAAVQAVNNLAQGLMSDGNSANNRVALVQFAGNTINSFNFQNNWADFDSRFVETAPSGCNYFRDAEGNIIQDYGQPAEGTVENPSGDGTNYTLGLEQARVFAESREDAGRNLVVLFVSDGYPEALLSYSNPTHLYRAWTQDYDGVQHHSVNIAASKDTAHPNVQAANGQSVLAQFSPTIYTIGIGTASNADSLIALSAQTGGTHSSIGWAQENDIDSLGDIADTIFGEDELLVEMTDAVITDVIADEFSLLIDEEHPVTLQRGEGEAITLTQAQSAVPDVHEYWVETIDYEGETRQQITVNMGTIDRNLLRVKFYITAANADMAGGNYPTNEEHTLSYKENDETKTRNDLGEPELPVDAEEPPVPLLPVAPATTPDEIPQTPTEETPEVPTEETPQTPTEEAPQVPTGETPAAAGEGADTLPPIPAEAPAPAVADFAITLPGGFNFDIPEAFVPLAAALEDTSIEIAGNEIPLAAFGESWALLNLLLTVATALASGALLVGYFLRKKKEEEEEREERYEHRTETATRLKRKGPARLFSIPVAVLAVIVFILTEDMSLPMTIVDEWTVLMLLIFIGQMIVTLLSRKKFVQDEDEQDVAHTAP